MNIRITERKLRETDQRLGKRSIPRAWLLLAFSTYVTFFFLSYSGFYHFYHIFSQQFI